MQALIREVAYNTLSRKDRKKLHLAAARYFESLGNDELAGVLASHYLAAHANAAEGDEADALAGQARIALQGAATRAAALGSHDQAVTFLDQALTVTTDPTDRAELLLTAAEFARQAGRFERAEQFAREGLEVARAVGSHELAGQATAQLVELLVAVFHGEEAAALIEPALVEFADADPTLLAKLRMGLARVHYGRSDYVASRDLIEQVLDVAEPLGLIPIVAQGMLMRANALWSLGRRREGWAVSEASKQLAADNGLIEIQLRSMSNQANGLVETDAADSAKNWREVIALTRKLGLRGLLIGGIGNFGYTAFVSGDWAEALAEMDSVLADDLSARDRFITLNNALIIRASRGEPVDEGLAEMHRLAADMSGQSHLFVADPEANAAMARGDLRQARDQYVAIFDADPGQPEYAYRAARAALWGRDTADAAALLARAEAAGAWGPVQDARLSTIRGGIAALDGRAVEALAHYRAALRDWRSSHSVLDEALTGVDMAQLLDPAEPEVAAAIRSSREILERLGAKPYLDRLEAAAAAGAGTASARAPRPASVVEAAVTE